MVAIRCRTGEHGRRREAGRVGKSCYDRLLLRLQGASNRPQGRRSPLIPLSGGRGVAGGLAGHSVPLVARQLVERLAEALERVGQQVAVEVVGELDGGVADDLRELLGVELLVLE
jgi:hypothetical protein